MLFSPPIIIGLILIIITKKIKISSISSNNYLAKIKQYFHFNFQAMRICTE